MALQVGSLYASLALNDASFVSGLKRAVAETSKASTAINSAMGVAKGAIVGFASAFSADLLIEATKKAFDYADGIVDLSDKVAASTQFIQQFGYAAQMSGSSVESAQTGLEKFAKKLGEAQSGSKSAKAELMALGVTSYDTDTAVRQAADGISKLDSRQQQLDATMGLFGKKAGDLTVLMSQGSKAVDELGSAASRLGVVLADDVLRNAGKVNDTLDTMSMVMSAQLANVIVQNADAFVTLANGMMQAAAAAVQFFSSMNNNAKLSILDGNPLTVDIPTLISNRRRGARGAEQQAAMSRQDLMGTKSGREALYQRNRRLREAAKPDSPEARKLERERMDIIRAEVVSRRAGRKALAKPDNRQLVSTPAAAKNKPAKSSSSGGGKTAVELAREAYERDIAYQNDLDRARGEYLGTQQDLSTNAVERFALEREQLEMERQRNRRDILKDGPQGGKRYTAAQVAELQTINDAIAYNKVDLVNRRENQFLSEEELRLRTAGIQDQRDLLSSASSNARTARERRDLELRILDLQTQQERLALNAIVASKEATDAERQIATARLGILDRLQTQQAQNIRTSTMGPLASYLDAIPQSAAEIDQAFENIAVGGLASFQSGMLDALMASKDLGETFGNVAKSIVRGLVEIALQQAIIKPIGASLFGGGSGGGGLLSGIMGGAKKLLGGAIRGGNMPADDFMGSVLGGKANGGMGNRGRWLVGERGPEIIEAGGPFNMIPNSALDGVRGNGGTHNTITVDARGSTDPVAVRALVWEGIAQAAPMLADNARKTTMRHLGRPRM